MEEELMGEPDTPTRESERGNSRDNSALLKHVFDSYYWLRIGMAITAFLFPPLLWVWGKFLFGLPLQGAMSAYYWASSPPGGDPPVRVWFVGLIFAIGSFLLLYKGYSIWEDWGLNLAAICLIGVALVPMCGSEVGQCPSWSSLHGWFAIAFFAFILSVAVFDWRFSLREVRDPARQRLFRRLYVFTSFLLFLLPAGAAIAHYFLGRADTRTYWLELAAIWAFALYWSIKTLELRQSLADRQELRNEVGRTENIDIFSEVGDLGSSRRRGRQL
jgi:hypothetical protein